MGRESLRKFHITMVVAFLATLMMSATGSEVRAHCEIPCGIYNDKVRMIMLEEDIDTIEKSMKEITALSSDQASNYNQLVRWVMNKDTHAGRIQETVTQYFMTQRIKPEADRNSDAGRRYVRQLTLLHGLLVHSMKAKQTTDIEHVQKMRSLLGEFADSYLSEADRKHIKDSHGF